MLMACGVVANGCVCVAFRVAMKQAAVVPGSSRWLHHGGDWPKARMTNGHGEVVCVAVSVAA